MIVLAALVVAGCGRYYGLAGVVHHNAQNDLRCDEDSTDVFEFNRNTFVARGCGQEANYQCHRGYKRCANLSALAADRASREFSCRPLDVSVRSLGPLVFQVQACGNTATYHCEMRGGLSECVVEGQATPHR